MHAFQSALGEELSLTCRERGCKTLEMAVETVEILERHTKKAVRAVLTEESKTSAYLKVMVQKCCSLK